LERLTALTAQTVPMVRRRGWITQSGLVARPANGAARAASAGGWTEVQ